MITPYGCIGSVRERWEDTSDEEPEEMSNRPGASTANCPRNVVKHKHIHTSVPYNIWKESPGTSMHKSLETGRMQVKLQLFNWVGTESHIAQERRKERRRNRLGEGG